MLPSRLHTVPGEHADPGLRPRLADAGQRLDLPARPGSLHGPATAVLKNYVEGRIFSFLLLNHLGVGPSQLEDQTERARKYCPSFFNSIRIGIWNISPVI